MSLSDNFLVWNLFPALLLEMGSLVFLDCTCNTENKKIVRILILVKSSFEQYCYIYILFLLCKHTVYNEYNNVLLTIKQ